MARYGYGISVSSTRKSAVPSSGGVAPITTSRAFDSDGVQVGSTNMGDIPEAWVQGETTITSVVFANDNSVTSIGGYAFQGCTSLTSISIPPSVTSIGIYAFQSCTSLATITFTPTSGVTSIGDFAFAGTAITSITIPNSVLSIGFNAFDLCSSLATATIGTGVTSIGSYAFYQCTSLTNVTFTPTSSVLTINAGAFRNCSSLTTISIPNSVTSIGEAVFQDCTGLATATIGTGVTSIGSYAFYSTALTSITIPNNVLTIGGTAFNNCGSLATVLCYVAQSAFTGTGAFGSTASPLVIQARITDASWTAGTGLTFQGNTNVTVIKNL